MPITIGDLKVYNVEEVAGLLQLQEKTVRRYLKEGRFHGRKVGNRWYISEDQLTGYFRENTHFRDATDEEVDRTNAELDRVPVEIDLLLERLCEDVRHDLVELQRECTAVGFPLDEAELLGYVAQHCHLMAHQYGLSTGGERGHRFSRPWSLEAMTEERREVLSGLQHQVLETVYRRQHPLGPAEVEEA